MWVVYLVVSTVAVGVASQSNYTDLTAALDELGPQLLGGSIDALTQSASLLGLAMLGGLTGSQGQAQVWTSAVLGVLFWLIVVWTLRALFAGNKIKVRDAFYNAGAPMIPTTLLVLLLAVQLLPGAIGVAVYTAITSGEVINGGVESMVFAVVAALLCLLSLYWASATLIALVVVTLPGTYPMVAIRAAGDVASGKRVAVMLRTAWVLVPLSLLWVIVLLPVLLLDQHVRISWLPMVPIAIQMIAALGALYVSTYFYVLYRRLIHEQTR
jgi:hypothetical protein